MTDLFEFITSTQSWPSWHLRGEAALRYGRVNGDSPPLKRGIGQRESPPKELPSKMVRVQRVSERQQLPQALVFDESHLNRYNNRKCAGTQTSFSSLNNEALTSTSSSLSTLSSPSSGSSTSSSSTDHYHVHSGQPLLLDLDKSTAALRAASASLHEIRVKRESDEQLSPLNLSNGASCSSSVVESHAQPHRPSVITCASTMSINGSNGVTVYDSVSKTSSHSGAYGETVPPTSKQSDVTKVVNTGMCGPAVEEHFRRSLGKIYPQSFSPVSSSSAMTAPKDQSPPLVSVSGAVDDHFAKSLGEQWSQIKVRNESSAGVLNDTVDDHFTKALGETWLRLKAKQNSSTNTRDTNPSPHSITCTTQSLLHS